MAAMTDPLIDVAGEMDEMQAQVSRLAELAPSFGGDAMRFEMMELGAKLQITRLRLRAFWTPQRRAFYEAAIMYAAAVGALRYEPIAESRAFHDAYHALVESERGESEGE